MAQCAFACSILYGACSARRVHVAGLVLAGCFCASATQTDFPFFPRPDICGTAEWSTLADTTGIIRFYMRCMYSIVLNNIYIYIICIFI